MIGSRGTLHRLGPGAAWASLAAIVIATSAASFDAAAQAPAAGTTAASGTTGATGATGAAATAGVTGAAAAGATAGAAGAAGSAPGQTPPVRVNDFPTLARVEYVLECLRDTPGPRHEMVYKCVCAADRVAEAVPYDRWVDLSTFFNAQPIAGERGAYVRESSGIQGELKAYRDLQANARKACFIPTSSK